jgi:hypothetical protein
MVSMNVLPTVVTETVFQPMQLPIDTTYDGRALQQAGFPVASQVVTIESAPARSTLVLAPAPLSAPQILQSAPYLPPVSMPLSQPVLQQPPPQMYAGNLPTTEPEHPLHELEPEPPRKMYAGNLPTTEPEHPLHALEPDPPRHALEPEPPRKVVEAPVQRKIFQAPKPLVATKDLEAHISRIACFMMFSLCFLPVMGAIACLCDRHYVFWMGCFWPTVVIAGCLLVFIAFVITINLLAMYATAEHRSQFTMAFTWATFVALLGIILVPISLMANKYAAHVAGTVSQGCLSTLPQSELLVDYNQVLYNIRLSGNCSSARSVTECQGWARNWYTDYLEYLEYDMQCGPLCPESPPPSRFVVAPDMYATPVPDAHPPYEPPLFGPPVQGVRGIGSFLQGQANAGHRGSMLQKRHHKATTSHHRRLTPIGKAGVMETALPHVQADRLFDRGTTRMTCFPLIATRLQVLLQTFGGLWYVEGMGLIVISFFTSLYTGCYFAFSKTAAQM